MKQLRPYQRAACEAIWKSFSTGTSSGTVVIPTGGGKTFTIVRFLQTVMTPGEKCLWITHRGELIEQARAEIQANCPTAKITDWNAKKKDKNGDFVLAMIGSTKRLRAEFDYVVIDEGHHAAYSEEEDYTNMYVELMKRIVFRYALLITATPGRLDRRGLLFPERLFQISFMELVQKQRLARPRIIEIQTKQRYSMALRGGEYTGKSLKQLDNPVRNRKIVDEYVENQNFYGKTLIFVGSVSHCYSLQDAFLNAGVSCHVVHGPNKEYNYTEEQRQETLKWFNEGDHLSRRVLINCQVFTEGYDVPTINSIFIARPTMSVALWMQMVGRGSRMPLEQILIEKKDIMKSIPVGDDGVMMFKLRSGRIVYGDILAETDERVTVLHQLVREFNLVQLVDDISKFGALFKEWQYDLREKTDEEKDEEEKERLTQEKREKILEATEGEIEPHELTDAKVRDMLGILRVCTKFHAREGYVIDLDRAACLFKLEKYLKDYCESKTGFSYEEFAEAYSFCVTREEFPIEDFEIIKWAYFYQRVQKKETIFNKDLGKSVAPIEYIHVSEMNDELLNEISTVAIDDMRAAELMNNQFNVTYGSEEEQQALCKTVYDRAIEIAKTVSNKRAGMLKRYRYDLMVYGVANRRISCTFDTVITQAYQLGELKKLREHLTAALQEILDDPNAVVTIKPKDVRIGKGQENANNV